MSFATAFLGAREDDSSEMKIATNVQTILQSISPEWEVDRELINVHSSNLCYGFPMAWVLGDGENSAQMRSMLRERLQRFEPRLSMLSEIDLREDTDLNTFTFFIRGNVKKGTGNEAIEIETALSRMDQYAEELS
jgi:predicted component of type VI protein secretion system